MDNEDYFPVRLIKGVGEAVNAFFDIFWTLLHRGHLMRRAAFIMSWFITFESFEFCYRAAEQSGWNPMTIGACFGILTPVSGLQAAVMKFYNDSRAVDSKVS